MCYRCENFGDCRTIDDVGECPLYVKFAKKLRK